MENQWDAPFGYIRMARPYDQVITEDQNAPDPPPPPPTPRPELADVELVELATAKDRFMIKGS